MNRLQNLREERGWNMSETAKQFNLPYTTYVSYEKGAREPNFDVVCRMAAFYDVSVTYLMGTSDIRGSFPKPDEDLIDFEPTHEERTQEFARRFEHAPRRVQNLVQEILIAAESGLVLPDDDSTEQ